jgi:outer membrane protein TolC
MGGALRGARGKKAGLRSGKHALGALALAAMLVSAAHSQSQSGSQSASPSSSQSSNSLPSAPTPSTAASTGSGSSSGSGSSNTGAAIPSGGAVSPSSQPQGSTGGGFPVQVPTESSLSNAYYGSVQAGPAVPHTIDLSLDDALRMGIVNNLGLIDATQTVEQQKAQRSQDLNILLPNIDVTGTRALHQYNLQAQGFRPGVLASFGSILGQGSGSSTGSATPFPFVVKVNVVEAQAHISQYLFDWAGYDLVKALGHLVQSSERSSAASRGTVVQNVGVAYLRVVAAQSQVAYDAALLKTDKGVLYQSQQEHEAGILANLDALRSQVQYQTQQQTLIQDQDTLAKAKIALNRSIGLAPEQEVAVTETTPFPALTAMDAEAATAEAIRDRQDYQSAMEQLKAAEYERTAAKHERYPSLIFNGNYGVTGVVGGIYHDTFGATGTLQIPIFQEAKFRSDSDMAQFQVDNARAQLGNLRGQIAQQVRDNLIDLDAASATIAVAQSNAELAHIAQEQAFERFRAGVEDNLSTVQAESTLASAQVQLVHAQFEYNQAKLNLAESLGRIDVDFHPEWQGGHPAGVDSDRIAMGNFGQ